MKKKKLLTETGTYKDTHIRRVPPFPMYELRRTFDRGKKDYSFIRKWFSRLVKKMIGAKRL